MTVYLLHFDRPYRHARHYSGWCHEGGLQRRLAEHASGNGARLMAVIHEAGLGFVVARTWQGGSRTLERRIKRRGGARLCPICHPQDCSPHYGEPGQAEKPGK